MTPNPQLGKPRGVFQWFLAGALVSKPRLGLDNDAAGIIVCWRMSNACPATSSLFLQVRIGLRPAREQCRGHEGEPTRTAIHLPHKNPAGQMAGGRTCPAVNRMEADITTLTRTKLTDTQLIALSGAAWRQDGTVVNLLERTFVPAPRLASNVFLETSIPSTASVILRLSLRILAATAPHRSTLYTGSASERVPGYRPA